MIRSTGRLVVLALGSLVAGLVLMIVFDATVTRVLGVTLLFASMVGALFSIAEPDFLERDDEKRPTPL
jgi:hypothetical protein